MPTLATEIAFIMMGFIFFPVLGPDSIKRWHLANIGNPIVEIRRSCDRLISTMGFPILVRRHLYIGSGPRLHHDAVVTICDFPNALSWSKPTLNAAMDNTMDVLLLYGWNPVEEKHSMMAMHGSIFLLLLIITRKSLLLRGKHHDTEN